MPSWVVIEMREHADYGEESVTTYDVPFHAIGPFDSEERANQYISPYLTEVVELDAP